jgi:hypothetical protein
MLIVLSGEAGAGKDSVADILVANHGFVKHSLATPLKRFAADMFGFTATQLYGPSRHRNEPDPRWERPCPSCELEGEVSESCALCRGKGAINDNSPRRILQLLGDEWLRQMIHPDALTLRARPEIEALLAVGLSVVVNDARFQNDRDNLHDWLGGLRVDVMAPDKKCDDAAWRQHGSELDRPSLVQVEHVLVNPEEHPFPNLPRLVEEMIGRLCMVGGD